MDVVWFRIPHGNNHAVYMFRKNEGIEFWCGRMREASELDYYTTYIRDCPECVQYLKNENIHEEE
jgi:hypothetical protein